MDSFSQPNKKNTEGKKKVGYLIFNLSGPEAHALDVQISFMI